MNGALRTGGLAVFALVAGCDRESAPPGNLASSMQANAVLEAAEENAAALAADEELANQAAADEAADMDLYGGNAAAGETGNAPDDFRSDANTAS